MYINRKAGLRMEISLWYLVSVVGSFETLGEFKVN